MVCCAAWGCANRPGMGKKMHRFPRDPKRRREWEIKVRRKDWKANNNSYLCSNHFDETQYESGRADNLKKLKPNAIPTLFAFSKIRPRKPPRKRCIDDVSVVEDPGKRSRTEHTYAKSDDGTCIQPQYSSSDGELITEADPLVEGETRADEDSIPVHSDRKEPPFPDSTAAVESSASQDTRMMAMEKTIEHLKQTLRKERREKRKLVKQKETQEMVFVKVFNQDQLDRLCRKSTRGVKWSDETIKKGLQLRSACGVTGYELLLSQKLPLPSLRTLRERLEVVATEHDNETPGKETS